MSKEKFILDHRLIKRDELRYYKLIEYVPQRIKALYQRAKYGVADIDAWSLDSYIYTVLTNGLRILARDTNGHPYNTDFDEWVSDLRKIAELTEYLQSDPDNTPVINTICNKMRYVNKESKEYQEYMSAYCEEHEQDARRRERVRKTVFTWLSDRIGDLWW